jgi:hypothetical protein
VKREAVEHAVRGHAALARHLDAPVRKINLAGRMGIGVDAHHASKIERPLVPAPIQIETPWVRVDFDGNAMGGAGGEDALNVDFVSRPSEQLTPGHVSKDGGVRICNCADDALCLQLFCQRLIRIIESAVGEDVRLNPFEDTKLLVGFVESVDGAVLLYDFLD